MKITEDRLAAEIKAGKLGRLYYIYGAEPLLIQMYVDRIIAKAVGEDPIDFNLHRLEGNPPADLLADYIDTLPVFSDVKVITIKDFNPKITVSDKTQKITYAELFADIPETAIVVLYDLNDAVDEKDDATKKFLAAAEKNGVTCRIELMRAPKIAELCVKKAAKSGIVISYDDALSLTERTGGVMKNASDEMAKLMSFVGEGGRITAQTIEALVPKRLEAEIYDLANAINAGKRAEAYRIIDTLFKKQTNAVSVMSALAGTFLDMYCSRLAKMSGQSAADAAKALGYVRGRAWVFTNKVFPMASRLDLKYLRESVSILSESDIAMKSVPVDNRTLIEEAVTKLFMCRGDVRG